MSKINKLVKLTNIFNKLVKTSGRIKVEEYD
mgnify:CR=1 FL=1